MIKTAIHRGLAWVLTAAMLLTVTPQFTLTARADEGDGNITVTVAQGANAEDEMANLGGGATLGLSSDAALTVTVTEQETTLITAFNPNPYTSPADPGTHYIVVDKGTAQGSIGLPMTLAATTEGGGADGYAVSVARWECVGKITYPAPSYAETFDGAAGYDADAPGTYRFAPVLALAEGVTLADGVTPPSVDVVVSMNMAVMPLDTTSVGYVNAAGVPQGNVTATVVDSSTNYWNNGWYVVNTDVTISTRVVLNGTVNLILADGGSLTAEHGINLINTDTLNIWAQSGGTGRLTANGDTSTAGIGGGNYANGTITINGGVITATGGLYSAGIGGGANGAGGSITINGGTVTATGGTGAEDIGNGSGASGGTVTITGGSVNAANISPTPTSDGSTLVYLNTLTIGASGSEQANAAVTEAKWMRDGGSMQSYGVNGVKTDSAGKVYFWLPVSGAEQFVTVTVGGRGYVGAFPRVADNNNAARLFSGSAGALINMNDPGPPYSGTNWTYSYSNGGVYTIQNGASVTVIGDNAGGQRRIEVEQSATNVTITLDNVTIGGLGDNQYPLTLKDYASVTLTLTGTNTLTAGQYRPGINVPSNATLTIDGAGSLTANGGNGGAGIGVGNGGAGDSGSITINGGMITATGGLYGAGIGGGNGTAGGNITISGGTVTATGGTDAQDIGKGANGSGGAVTITGGSVKAANISPAPTNGGGASVYLNTLTIGSPAVANAAVTAVGGALAGYGINDVVTDGGGKLYFWLTETADNQTVSVTVGGNVYKGTYTRAANNNNAQTLRILTAPTITTASLPNGTEGTAYSATLTATGDTPITWSVTAGSLPNGLALSSDGVISGTPTTAGTATFTVKASNGTAPDDTKQLSITISTAGGGNNNNNGGGSGGSSSGGGSSPGTTPAPATPPASNVIVDGKAVDVGAVTVNALTLTVEVTVNQQTITGQIAAAQNNVKVSVPAVAGTAVYKTTFTVKNITDMNKKGVTLTVQTPIATLTFTGGAQQMIAAAGKPGDPVVITVSKVDRNSLTQAQGANVPDDALILDFSVTVGGKTVSDFGGGTAEVSIPYTLPSGVKSTQIVAYYLNAAGGLEMVKGVYNPVTKTVDISLFHFSRFVIKVNSVKYTVGAGWYDADSLDFAVQRGLVKVINGVVEPTATTSRADFVVAVMKALGVAPLKKFTVKQFADVGHLSAEQQAYLRTARQYGVIASTGNNKFEPDSPALREQYFQIVYNLYGAALAATPAAINAKTAADFTDGALVPAWALTATNFLLQRGLIQGDGNRLGIGTAFNSGTTAVMLARLGGAIPATPAPTADPAKVTLAALEPRKRGGIETPEDEDGKDGK